MLCAITREAPAACAASTRMRVPSLRRRSFSSKSRSIRRGSMRCGSEVSWWMTASGRAAATTARTAPASSASATAAWRPVPTQLARALGRARHARHLVATGEQHRHELPADRAGRAGEEDPHAACSGHARVATGTLHPRAHGSLVEPGRAEVERGVEARAQVLDGDEVDQLDHFRIVEVLAQRREQLVAHLHRRDGHADGEVEHEPLELVEVRALPVPIQVAQLGVADSGRERLEGADVLAHLAALHHSRLQRHERLAGAPARAAWMPRSARAGRSRSAARVDGRGPGCLRASARGGRSSAPLHA